MMRVIVMAGGVLLLSALACERAGTDTTKVELRNAQGESVGTATLEAVPDGVKIVLQASRLPPGRHGFHFHAAGRCEPPDFSSAGSHFNPQGKEHGLENPAGPHAGDLPDLMAGPEGTVQAEVVAPHVSLETTVANSLFQPDRTALVIHADPDDQKTDPDGNAGARIACGVITK
jgi:superoxide dismutase, Cu-Zn family